MLEVGHCAVHPSKEAHLRCRSCGRWLCDRCAPETPRGIFCSRSCRARASAKAVKSWLRRLFTSPLEPQWTIAATGALVALLLGGIGLLVAELIEVNTVNNPPGERPDQPALETARLVETEHGWEVEVRGPAGARVLVLDRSGRTMEMTLDTNGTASKPAEVFDESTVWVEGLELPAVPRPPTPAPTEPPSIRGVSGSSAVGVVPTPVHSRKTATPTPAPVASPEPSPPVGGLSTVSKSIEQSETLEPTAVPEPVPPPKPARRATPPSPPILHLVPDGGPRIAITFDGGASSNRTAELLDLLHDLDIEATLFLTGGFIRAQPALVRRAVLSGHEVGNHTDTHLHLTTYASDQLHTTLPEVSRERLLGELKRTEEAFQRATGRPMAPLWRAPYGEENPALRRWAFEAGYLHVRWSSLEGKSLDTMDWIEDEHSPYFRDSRRIMDRLLRFPRLRGGIILMHLATDREEPPWTHLPEFVAALRSRNIEPAKVTTLLSESRIWRSWLEKAARRHREANPTFPELYR